MSDDLFAALTSTPAVRDATSGRAWAQAMLDAEAALARGCAAAGLIPADAAATISAACRAGQFDLSKIADDAMASGNPVPPLVDALRSAAGEDAGRFVHWGATSQDIVDTAMVLILRRTVELILGNLEAAAREAARLADDHRETVMVARTLLQHAAPTTFGLKAAGWLVALVDVHEEIARAVNRLPAQLGGAAGTLAAFGQHGMTVLQAYAVELQLPEPPVPWHTARGRLVEMAAALGVAAGVCEKIAVDIGLLAQTDVGEAYEGAPHRGGSSSLPHKRNPVAVAAVRAAAKRAQGEVQVILGAMAHEHERALGSWQSEWPAVTDLLRATGTAAWRTGELLGELEVDATRMAANLRAGGGLALSEAVVTALAPVVGRPRAMSIVTDAARAAAASGGSLRDELALHSEVAAVLDGDALDAVLDPAAHLGAVEPLIERALTRFKEGQP